MFFGKQTALYGPVNMEEFRNRCGIHVPLYSMGICSIVYMAQFFSMQVCKSGAQKQIIDMSFIGTVSTWNPHQVDRTQTSPIE